MSKVNEKVPRDDSPEKLSQGSDQDSDIEWVSSEKGWAYMVCLGFAILFFILTGPMSSFGLLFSDFFDDIGEGTSAVTLVNGVFNAVVSCSGFITTGALKRFTNRQVGIIGAVIYVIGSFLTIFVKSISHLLLTFAFLQGVGFGIMVPISLTNFNDYFVKRRVAMMSVASVLIGSGAIIFPEALRVSMEQYGFRGTLALLCAVNCHTILAMVLMQPVEMHLVPKNRNFGSTTPGVTIDYYSEITTAKTEKELPEKQYDLKKVTHESIDGVEKEIIHGYEPLIPQGLMVKSLGDKGRSLMELNEKNLFLTYSAMRRAEHGEGGDGPWTVINRASSLASLGNWTGNVLASETATKKNGRWDPILDFLDLELLKDPVYSNICFGISFSFFADITFFILEPILLKTYGFSKSEIALCITVGAAADVVSRFMFAIINFYVKLKSRHIFFVGTWFIIIFRTAFMQYSDFYHVLVFTACLGFFRNWLHVPLPLVFAEHCSQERFPAAYGLYMMISGMVMLLTGPLVGLLRDITNSYIIAFHSLTIFSFFCVIPWSVEMYYCYRIKKRSTNK